jgi:hypothetical protein
VTVEYANHHEVAYRDAAARAPAHIRAKINRARSLRGLPPLGPAAPPAPPAQARGPVVWIDPASPLARRLGAGPVKPAASRQDAGQIVDRVLIVAAYGRARPDDIGSYLPEQISRDAFGPADQLRMGWLLKDQHPAAPGSILAMGGMGDGLRAHDTELGLVVEWFPDRSKPHHRDMLRRIQAGHTGASVGFTYRKADVRTMRLPEPCDVVMKARLEHVAIGLPRDGGAYRGAIAKSFRARRGHAGDLARDLKEIIAEARFAETHRK